MRVGWFGVQGIWWQAAARTGGKYVGNLQGAVGLNKDVPVSYVLDGDLPDTGDMTIDPNPIIPGTTYKICGTFRGTYVDAAPSSTFYDSPDYLAEPGTADYPASYALAFITQDNTVFPNNNVRWLGYLDADGCTTAVGLKPNQNHFLYIEPKFKRGEATAEVWKHDDVTHGAEDAVSSNNTLDWAQVGFFRPLITNTGKNAKVIKVPSASHTHGTRVAAVVARIFATDDAGLGDSHYQIYADEICYNNNGGRYSSACAGGALIIGSQLGGFPHNSYFKYVIAHEFGHVVQRLTGAGVLREGYHSYYDDEVATDMCRCDHVEFMNRMHCLQSREGLGD